MKLENSIASNAFNYKYLLKRFYPYLKPALLRIVIAFLLAIPLGLLDGVTAFALKPYIDVVVNGEEFFDCGFFKVARDVFATAVPFLIIAFATIQGGLKYINNYLVDWISLKISNAIKMDLFHKMTKLDSKFYDDNTSGIVLMRFLADPDAASRSFIDCIKSLITSSVSAFGLIVVLLYNGWKLAGIAVVVLGCAFLPCIWLRKKIKSVSNASAVLGGKINTNFNETYHGNKIMTGYCLQNRLNEKFDNQIRDSFDLAISLTKRVGWLSPIMYIIASFGIAIVMWYGNILLMSGEMTTGNLASFITSLLLLYKPVKDLGNTLTSLQQIFVAMSRVFELFDLQPEILGGQNELQGLNDNIEFSDVSFAYDENKTVLKHINLKVKKGETIAIVGNSGGGKSTIVNLIPRFYDVSDGAIKIDGADIRDFTLDSLRSQVSEVFQDNFLFSGTIRSNIMMGNENASEEELNRVVKAAHIDEFINDMTDGLDSVIGERGVSLSGGQRQRIAIARAMIKNSPIIILDEATSALDNKSEEIVQRALENLMQNKTVFVIAHRLSTIRNADKIIVIHEGELVEEGVHDELLKIENGKYKYLYEMQFVKTQAK